MLNRAVLEVGYVRILNVFKNTSYDSAAIKIAVETEFDSKKELHSRHHVCDDSGPLRIGIVCAEM